MAGLLLMSLQQWVAIWSWSVPWEVLGSALLLEVAVEVALVASILAARAAV